MRGGVVKEATETMTTNALGQLLFPSGRTVIVARVTIDDASYGLFLMLTGTGDGLSRYYLDSTTEEVTILPSNKSVTVKYKYIED